MIDGVHVQPLRQILDERGKVMHMLRITDAHFQQFGEIYFSTVNPGAIKAWHQHKEMTLNYSVPHGNITRSARAPNCSLRYHLPHDVRIR